MADSIADFLPFSLSLAFVALSPTSIERFWSLWSLSWPLSTRSCHADGQELTSWGACPGEFFCQAMKTMTISTKYVYSTTFGVIWLIWHRAPTVCPSLVPLNTRSADVSASMMMSSVVLFWPRRLFTPVANDWCLASLIWYGPNDRIVHLCLHYCSQGLDQFRNRIRSYVLGSIYCPKKTYMSFSDCNGAISLPIL